LLLLALRCPALRAQEPPSPGAAPMSMSGFYGPYGMQREASGTSWQPDSTPQPGLNAMRGAWMTMLDGFADGIYDDQGGPRGNTQTFSTSMLMFMALRALDAGACGGRFMISGDPLMGPSGYPLLFQTGETANGRVPLIDRQHPHNLLMEVAAACSRDLSAVSSLYLYAGPVGEPALGPPVFMQRLSGMDNPEAPLTHHWLDSTHVTFGVVTAGYVWRQFKLEGSAFNGREPDENRYSIQLRPLDSWSARLAYNPTRDLSLQVSSGRLASPEQLEPDVSERRTTASASYNAPLFEWWQTTLAWGRNTPSQGPASNGWLLESALRIAPAHTFFGRLERVAKDELFLPASPLYGGNFTINKLSLGYICDFARFARVNFGVGGLVSEYSFPAALNQAYGYRPTSFMLFVRARL
jgi:hypothetical protein